MNCSSDHKIFATSPPSVLSFKSFSRSLEQFFLAVGQNNFGNKITFLNSVSGLFTKKILLFQVGVGLSSAGIHSFEEDNNLIGGLASSDHLCEPPDDGGGGGAGGRVRFVNSTVRYHMASGAAQTLWTGRTSLEKILMVRVHQIVSPI